MAAGDDFARGRVVFAGVFEAGFVVGAGCIPVVVVVRVPLPWVVSGARTDMSAIALPKGALDLEHLQRTITDADLRWG
jgi:hypothetical protein